MEIKCVTKSLCQESIASNKVLAGDFIEITPNCKRSLSILDLNDDCLEVIFMTCNLKQLFSVIVAHSRFLTACRRIFAKQFKHKEITIQATNRETADVLSHVGDIVQYLRVNYDRNDASESGNNRKIQNAIVQHCSNNLIEVTFNNIEVAMQVDRAFLQLEQLCFNHGCVGQIMSEFNKWFPNLNRLEFFFSKTIDVQCIEHTFPHLQHFTVAHQNFTLKNLQTFLDLNPQLQTFTVYNYDRILISRLDAYTRLHFKSLTTKFETFPCYFAFDTNWIFQTLATTIKALQKHQQKCYLIKSLYESQ